MATITTTTSLSFDAAASLTVGVDKNFEGSIAFSSANDDVWPSFTVTKPQSKTYGPFGIAMTVVITVGNGSLDYTINGGSGGFGYDTDGNITGLVSGDGFLYFGSYVCTWATLPSASAGIMSAFVTDIGTHGSLWYSNGTTWGLANGSCVLAHSAVSVSASATTAEESLFSMAIPAGLMGLNGALRLSMLWTTTNGANDKTLRARLGATALTGSAWFALVNTATASTQIPGHVLRSRNSASSQVCFPAANGGVGMQSGTAVSTFTEDTSVATVFALTGQKETAGEVLTLEGFTLELLRP